MSGAWRISLGIPLFTVHHIRPSLRHCTEAKRVGAKGWSIDDNTIRTRRVPCLAHLEVYVCIHLKRLWMERAPDFGVDRSFGPLMSDRSRAKL